LTAQKGEVNSRCMTPEEEPNTVEKSCCEDAINEWISCAEKAAQREPLKCAAIAFMGGVVLTVLPVGAIVGGLARLALVAVRPALVVLGALKVIEEVERRTKP
jgi:hypothetical protein